MPHDHPPRLCLSLHVHTLCPRWIAKARRPKDAAKSRRSSLTSLRPWEPMTNSSTSTRGGFSMHPVSLAELSPSQATHAQSIYSIRFFSICVFVFKTKEDVRLNREIAYPPPPSLHACSQARLGLDRAPSARSGSPGCLHGPTHGCDHS